MTNILKYDISIDTQALIHNLRRITNQIYKLLPSREEGLDWQKPLETLIEELSGLDRLLLYDTPTFLTLYLDYNIRIFTFQVFFHKKS